MVKKFKVVLPVLIVSVFMLVTQVGFAEASLDGYYNSIINTIQEKFDGDVTKNQLIESSLKGMFSTMDPFTTFFTNEEANGFFENVSGQYGGIGVSVIKSGDYLLATKVFEGSPAQGVGILAGDKIATVDGNNVAPLSLDDAISLVKGEIGTKVSLGILKFGAKDIQNVDVVRDSVKINPVSYDFRGDVAYIKIDIFNSNLYGSLNKVLKEADKRKITKLILDLRGNPGGELEQVVEVAKKFVPKGLITSVHYKSSKLKNEEYKSDLEDVKYKLSVLVNGDTASASEILAGAIQDTKVGVLVGTKTFGKGSVQITNPVLTPEALVKYTEKLGVSAEELGDLIESNKIKLSSGDIMGWAKITQGGYYTPKGRSINNIGLEPDIKVDASKVKDVDLLTIDKLSKTTKPVLGFQSLDVYNAESILKLLGYDVDKADYTMDEKTVQAISKFQADSGLYPYGVMDFATQDKLNQSIPNILLQFDRQYAIALQALNQF